MYWLTIEASPREAPIDRSARQIAVRSRRLRLAEEQLRHVAELDRGAERERSAPAARRAYRPGRALALLARALRSRPTEAR